MSAEETKTYFVVIRYGGDEPIINRIRECAAEVKETIERVSSGRNQLVFTSQSGDCFGYLLQSELPMGAITAKLNGETHSDEPSPLRIEDRTFIIEVGEQYGGRGFSKAWNWLDYRDA